MERGLIEGLQGSPPSASVRYLSMGFRTLLPLSKGFVSFSSTFQGIVLQVRVYRFCANLKVPSQL